MIPYGVGPPFGRTGRARTATTSSPSRRSSRGRTWPRLVEGFRRSGLDGLELRVVGAEGWGDVRVEGDRIRRLEGVDDEELARLYRGAACVAYVSLYEGFGLPVLEAMACARAGRRPRGAAVQRVRARHRVRGRPARPGFDRRGLQRAVAAGKQLGRRAARGRLQLGAAVQAHVDLYRELAA